MSKIRLIIKGPYPPPFGGISVFIKRFIYYLEKKNIVYLFIQDGEISLKKVIRKIIFGSQNVVHINDIGVRHRKILFFYRLLGKRTVLTVHGASLEKQIESMYGLKQKLYINLLKRVNAIIVVNERIKQYLIGKGFNSNKVFNIPAFLPPVPEETDTSLLPEFFHRLRKKHKFLITANASHISFHNNEDLYGIDLSIELMNRLKKDGYQDIGFIYVIPDIGDQPYFNKMKQLIADYELDDCFHFYTEPVAYPAVLNLCDLFIRPTNTDGDAISIREALTLNIPVIASDIVPRPKDVILFKNRDVIALYDKVKHVIDHYTTEKTKLNGISFENNAEKIIEVYKRVLSKNILN